MEEIILSSEKLSVGYDKKVLIPEINISVKKGEILVLIGPNGAGKSTVLNTISYQLEAVSGVVKLSGKDMQGLKSNEIAKKLSLLGTKRPGAELMTIWDMVATGRYPYTGSLGILSAADKDIVDETIKQVGLEAIKEQEFNRISDGQRQRTMLARAVCQEPEVLILDEPTSFLDIHYKLELISMVKRMARERNIAVVMSLHELDLAQKCADMLLCIKDGRIDKYGTPEEIFYSNNYIEELYNVEKGCFLGDYGSLELERMEGKPEVFVIGGGGSAIQVYRSLQRQGVPFAAGVISENDIEYPVAKALAVKVITEKAFEPVGLECIREAKKIMTECRRVICCVKEFGTLNAGNEDLKNEAEKLGLLG